MPDTYTQDIKRFVKHNHIYFCARAYESKDILNFCRHFFMSIMDRSNIIAFDKTPVVLVIHQLTRWDKDTIKRNIAKLKLLGEIQKIGHNKVIYNDLIANRVTLVRNHNGYEGQQPTYSADELRIVQEINKLIKTESQENEMQALIKKFDKMNEELNSKLDKMNKALDFLMSKANKEDVVEVQTYLRLVKDNEK